MPRKGPQRQEAMATALSDAEPGPLTEAEALSGAETGAGAAAMQAATSAHDDGSPDSLNSCLEPMGASPQIPGSGSGSGSPLAVARLPIPSNIMTIQVKPEL